MFLQPALQPGADKLRSRDHVRTLAGFVQQVEDSIAACRELSRQLLAWIAAEYDATKQKLLLLYAWQFPNNPAVENRRASLERSLESLISEQRQEELACWRDHEVLNKELRHSCFAKIPADRLLEPSG